MSNIHSVPLTAGLDISPIKGVLGGIFLLFAGIYLYIYPYRQARLLFKNVRGPPATSGLWGNATEIFTGEPMMAHQGWTDQYGPTFRYPFVLGSTKLSTIDPKVIGMILNDTTTFPKPKVQIESLAKVLGQGILTVQHETHRRQRRVMAPAFGPAAIRALEDIIFDKTILLRNKIADFLEDDSLESSPTPAAPEDRIPGTRKVDIEKYLAELSLDVIGLAGFDYSIDCERKRAHASADSSPHADRQPTRRGLPPHLFQRTALQRLHSSATILSNPQLHCGCLTSRISTARIDL
jgi:cytochrome P450